MKTLDQKLNRIFGGKVVRKDLTKLVKGNAIVPTYVLEYLLGQYCATDDEETIKQGVETVRNIISKHFVHRDEAEIVKSKIKEKNSHRIIDKVSVSLNESKGVYEATFINLNVRKVLVETETIKKHPKLLSSGVWCIVQLSYLFTEEKGTSPWIIESLKPIQVSSVDLNEYKEARKAFTKEEWIDVLIQSIGLVPEKINFRSKLIQLARLIPFCENNFNLIELGPKGTGKSHLYTELSPHGILVSGGEVSIPNLFINNTSGRMGLVGYWDVVAFDEFAGTNKKGDAKLKDIMQNYMANKSFSRGVETIGAEASMVFVGNTRHTLPYMLKHTDLFDELPEQYYDSAFLDRIHFYLPGWEVDIIRGEMFSDGYGFVVDYLAEILRTLRNHDFSQLYSDRFNLLSDISTRDLDAINKTFSGLMKILFPHEEATEKEIEELLQFAIEGRKRVKDQLMRIDQTYEPVRFGYVQPGKKDSIRVQTLEEKQYPQYYYKEDAAVRDQQEIVESTNDTFSQNQPVKDDILKEKQIIVQENQKGISFDELFGPYLKGSAKITITDPYIRLFYQARNFMELLETIAKVKSDDDEVEVHLVTVEDEFKGEQQKEYLMQIQENVWATGIKFSWEFDESNSIHARHIVTDNGWKILLDRGLDIFQHYDMNQAFSINNRLQKYRSCKAFEVTFLRTD